MFAGFARLQLIGPIALFSAILAAEGAALALAQAPTSGFLWYLNLEVFRVFQRSHVLLSEYLNLPFVQLLLVGVPLAALAAAGTIFRQRLMVATSSNIAFVFACFLAYSWYRGGKTEAVASLSSISVSPAPDTYLFVLLLAASFLSACVSHLTYIREVRQSGV